MRLDRWLVARGYVPTRSQADSFIGLGQVLVNNQAQMKSSYKVKLTDRVKLVADEQYVSRAGLKLASISRELKLDFKGKTVLDVGSSTGGFTDYALQNGAKKIIAVDVGTSQLHPSLIGNPKIDLREQTDIRDVDHLENEVDIVLIDVSFISIREILTHLPKLIAKDSLVVAMVKPQFEVGDQVKHKGVIKNDKLRRQILKDFETWSSKTYKIYKKADSKIAGAKGNVERFYLLRQL